MSILKDMLGIKKKFLSLIRTNLALKAKELLEKNYYKKERIVVKTVV